MALSGLGPALSGAYANIQRLLVERKLQQEDLERRRRETLADRQAQWGEEMRRVMLQRQWAEEARIAAEREPGTRLARALQVGPHIPGGVDIADILREMGFPIPSRQVEQGVATVGMPPPGMEGLEAPRPGQILPQQRVAFGGVREEPGRVMVGPPRPRRTYGEAYPAGSLKPGWAAMAMPVDAQGNEKPDANAFVQEPKEKEKTIPVVISGQTFNVTEQQAANLASAAASRAATAGTRPQMVTIKDPVSGKTVTIPATSLPSFFPRRVPGAGGATETLASMKADIIRRKKAGLPIAEWELRFAGIAFEKQPEGQNLAYLKREEQKAQIKVAGLRRRVDSPALSVEGLEKAQAALAEAEGEHEALRNAVTAAMQGRTGLPSLVSPATPGPFSLRGPGVSPAPSAPVPQKAAPTVTPGPRSITTAELRLIAQRKGMTFDAARKQAVKRGYTVLP